MHNLTQRYSGSIVVVLKSCALYQMVWINDWASLFSKPQFLHLQNSIELYVPSTVSFFTLEDNTISLSQQDNEI